MPNRFYEFYSDTYYHIYNRSFSGNSIFLEYKDYERFYLKMAQIEQSFENYNFKISARCLMPNHFHLLTYYNTKENIDPVTKFMHRLQTSYAMYYNKKYSNKGQVFTGRFKTKAVYDDRYLYTIINYIQKNSEKHFNINYTDRKYRSDINIEGSSEETLEEMDKYKIEI